jgi:hypothetical protein
VPDTLVSETSRNLGKFIQPSIELFSQFVTGCAIEGSLPKVLAPQKLLNCHPSSLSFGDAQQGLHVGLNF